MLDEPGLKRHRTRKTKDSTLTSDIFDYFYIVTHSTSPVVLCLNGIWIIINNLSETENYDFDIELFGLVFNFTPFYPHSSGATVVLPRVLPLSISSIPKTMDSSLISTVYLLFLHADAVTIHLFLNREF